MIRYLIALLTVASLFDSSSGSYQHDTSKTTPMLLSSPDKPMPKPLKVCVLCEPSPITYVSGYANRFREMLRYLSERNDDVQLVTAECLVETSKLPRTYLDIPIHYTYGIRLPFYRAMTISIDWTFCIGRVLHQQKPDIIHATSPGFMVIAAIFYSRLFRIPLVVSYHTDIPAYLRSYVPPYIRPITEWIVWRLLRLMRFADLTLVTSEQIQQQLLDRRVVTRCAVWQKGIDTERFHPRNKNTTMRHRMTDGQVDDFLLLYVGRIAKEKRLDDLREVLERLQETCSNCRLCFVGTGPYLDELKNKVFHDHPSVSFLGELHGEELAQTYASADVFTFPSDSETLGFVVLEAMASGLPVVAARAGGVPSLIDDGKTSFLCKPGEISEYVQKILVLKDNPTLYDTISGKARQHTLQWNWDASMQKLRLDQYNQAKLNYEQRWGIRLKHFVELLK